jgi:hypothetical protein
MLEAWPFALPTTDTIPVRYTEEEAEYMSLRPVVRQSFRLHELLDMILAVTGKDPQRIARILESGTVVFHNYRYWWPALALPEHDLQHLLEQFPIPDSSRPFAAGECRAVLLDTGGSTPHRLLEWRREVLARRRWLARRTAWDVLLDSASRQPPAYADYSYEWKGDLYVALLGEAERLALAREMERLLARASGLRAELLLRAARLFFLCPRRS